MRFSAADSDIMKHLKH